MPKVQFNDCKRWFSGKDILKRHQRNVHGKENPPPLAVATPSTPMQPLKFPSPPPKFIPPPQTTPPQPVLPPPRESIPPPPSQQRQEGFVFKHPFTATIYIGPHICGKTHFCKVLLLHCLTMIWPPPERILWLYKRWQPLYDVIKSTVYPIDKLFKEYL